MRRKRLGWIPVLVLLAAVLVGLIFAEDILRLYRNVSYYMDEPTETELKVQEYAEAHGLTFGDYPGSLVALLERNPETETFVLEYPCGRAANMTLPNTKTARRCRCLCSGTSGGDMRNTAAMSSASPAAAPPALPWWATI